MIKKIVELYDVKDEFISYETFISEMTLVLFCNM